MTLYNLQQEFGFEMNVPVTVDDVRVRGVGKSFESLGRSVFEEAASLSFSPLPRTPDDKKCAETASVYFEEGGRRDVPVYLLEKLDAGDLVEGPGQSLLTC